MAAFVAHLDIFEGPLPSDQAVTELRERSGWALSGCRTRVNRARAIIDAGRRTAALDMIAVAARVPDATRDAARRLAQG